MCSNCNIDKPLEEFHKDRTQKDGYKKICKPCRSKVQKNYRQTKTVEEDNSQVLVETLRSRAMVKLVENHKKEFIHIFASLKRDHGLLPEWRQVHEVID